MSSIIFKHFNNGAGCQYGDYVRTDAGNIDKAKEELLEQMFTSIREIAKKDEFWIVKHIGEDMVTVGWKAQFPQLEPEKDYKQRMQEEYWEVKQRYNKLHQMCIKYEADTLDLSPSCSLELLQAQKKAMREYLDCLEIRAEIEEIKL